MIIWLVVSVTENGFWICARAYNPFIFDFVHISEEVESVKRSNFFPLPLTEVYIVYHYERLMFILLV